MTVVGEGRNEFYKIKTTALLLPAFSHNMNRLQLRHTKVQVKVLLKKKEPANSGGTATTG